MESKKCNVSSSPITCVNGKFWLAGRARDNPSAEDIMRNGVQEGGPELIEILGEGHNTGLWVYASDMALDPFNNASWVTMYMYEFNGLTDEEGDTFVWYYLDMVGVPGGLGRFYKEFFYLPTTPMVSVNGAPKWG